MNCLEMSVSEWVAVPDNPRQRNTEKRAKAAKVRHLKKYEAIHKVVFAAALNGTVICKLDGHTRGLLWQKGELECPPDGKVQVVLIPVSGISEAKRIYDMLDSQPTVKKPSDNIYGAARELGFRMDSHLLRSCAFNTALKIASSGKKFRGNTYAMVSDWKGELIALDKACLTSQNTILIAVMLTACRIDGPDRAIPFFLAVDKNEGTKTSGGYDGVECLIQIMKVRRAQGRTAGYDNLMQICGQAWTAYQMWKNGSRCKTARLAIADFTSVVNSANASKLTQQR